MKKFFILFCSLVVGIGSFSFNQSTIDERYYRFSGPFPTAEEVNWFETKETWIVSFKENGVRTRAVYNRNGQLHNLSRSYSETNLP
jgi:hypothetical protein